MHVIAYIYHWGRDELRRLRIRERKMWAEKIIEQKEKENKAVEKATEEARAKSKVSRRR